MLDWDSRRSIEILPTADEAVAFAADHWIHTAERSIQQHGRFAVALSGGSTPKAIFRQLLSKHKKSIDWSKVYLFWSDERAVNADHPDSNYRMAMENGFQELAIPPSQIFRLKGEGNLTKSAEDYESILKSKLDTHLLNLVMLGVGEDGHTASLFPKTTALEDSKHLVVANFLTEKDNWRLTFTFKCINESELSVIYAIGENKQTIVPLVLNAAIISDFPASRVGTPEHKSLWILDQSAARLLTLNYPS